MTTHGGSAGAEDARRIVFDGPSNFRDLGGYGAANGAVVRCGLLYRSDSLHRFSDEDLVRFATLGIRTVFDLRGPAERQLWPNRVPNVHLDINGAYLAAEPSWADRPTLRHGEERLLAFYLTVLSDAAPLIGTFFTTLANDGLPAVFHCAGGKDRTGMLAAILLRWLGVDREAVLDDYELTTAYARPADRELVRGIFVAAGLTPEAAAGVLSTPRWAMAEALETLENRYGGAEPYLLRPAGVNPDALARLRELLLDHV